MALPEPAVELLEGARHLLAQPFDGAAAVAQDGDEPPAQLGALAKEDRVQQGHVLRKPEGLGVDTGAGRGRRGRRGTFNRFAVRRNECAHCLRERRLRRDGRRRRRALGVLAALCGRRALGALGIRRRGGRRAVAGRWHVHFDRLGDGHLGERRRREGQRPLGLEREVRMHEAARAAVTVGLGLHEREQRLRELQGMRRQPAVGGHRGEHRLAVRAPPVRVRVQRLLQVGRDHVQLGLAVIHEAQLDGHGVELLLRVQRLRFALVGPCEQFDELVAAGAHALQRVPLQLAHRAEGARHGAHVRLLEGLPLREEHLVRLGREGGWGGRDGAQGVLGWRQPCGRRLGKLGHLGRLLRHLGLRLGRRGRRGRRALLQEGLARSEALALELQLLGDRHADALRHLLNRHLASDRSEQVEPVARRRRGRHALARPIPLREAGLGILVGHQSHWQRRLGVGRALDVHEPAVDAVKRGAELVLRLLRRLELEVVDGPRLGVEPSAERAPSRRLLRQVETQHAVKPGHTRRLGRIVRGRGRCDLRALLGRLLGRRLEARQRLFEQQRLRHRLGKVVEHEPCVAHVIDCLDGADDEAH